MEDDAFWEVGEGTGEEGAGWPFELKDVRCWLDWAGGEDRCGSVAMELRQDCSGLLLLGSFGGAMDLGHGTMLQEYATSHIIPWPSFWRVVECS